MRFLERGGPKLHNRQQRAMIQVMESELDNIRAAWHWAAQEGNFTAIQIGAHAYYDLNDIRGRYQEMIDATSPAIERHDDLYASVVDKHIQPREFLRESRRHRLDLLRLREIPRDDSP